MNWMPGTAMILLAAISLPSCSLFASDPEKPITETPTATNRLVGRVASISAGSTFVLIQSYGNWNVPVGSVLTARGNDDRTSNLRSTGEKLGQFAAADIQAGTPQVGDGVFYLVEPELKSAPETPSASPDSKNKAAPTPSEPPSGDLGSPSTPPESP
jgi:hypothetical protein